MKYKIGIFGSAVGDYEKMLPKAQELGEEITKYKDKLILITGVADGLPYKVAYTASKKGVEVWGFAPSVNSAAQKKISPTQDLSIYKKIFYIPKDYQFVSDLLICRKYRNVSSTATCDAGIIISGRWGTMHEFSSLFDFGKVIGVYTKTGGIADELKYLNSKIHKKSEAKVIFNYQAKELIKNVLIELKSKKRHNI